MDLIMQVSEKLKCVSSLTNCDQFELPSVIVVGERNSGKSSVIERLVGHSFLPIGRGNTTRYPMELNLVKKENDDIPDWAVFLSTPECLITDFKHVMQNIELETERRTECPNNLISAEPISLKIHSRKVTNIRLVDLPGLLTTHDGSQQEDLQKLLKNISLKYISNPKSVVLVVISATDKISTSEGLKLLEQVDPSGSRSLIVLTKIDLVISGESDINDILSGRTMTVNLNIIGVVNTFQKDYKESLCKVMKDETMFFKKYFPLLAHNHGITQLSLSICHLFQYHINELLPKLKEKVTAAFRRYRQVLATYGEPIVNSYKTMLDIISNFSVAYASTILGPYKELETSELTGGARINYIFREIFGQAVREIDPLSEFSRTTLLTAIRNASGVKSTLFIPDKCFELLVKKQIKKLEGPSLRCAQLVYDEMEKHIDNCGKIINLQLRRFPKLKQQIKITLFEMLKSRMDMTNDMIHQVINIQTAYINTGHPDFILEKHFNNPNSNELCTPDFHNQAQSRINFQDNLRCNKNDISYQCLIIERLIMNYFNIVRTAIEDMVPKTIMHFLVNYTAENLQSELVAKLFVNGMPDTDLMKESSEIVQERKRTIELMQSHEQAISIITEIKKIIK